MYALSFDMIVSKIKEHYGEHYNNALTKAIMDLSRIDWFKKSVRDIRGYRVEDWSNFTDIIKNY